MRAIILKHQKKRKFNQKADAFERSSRNLASTLYGPSGQRPI